MEHQDQPTFKIPNVVKQYATDILLKYPDITITEMEKFLRNKFQLDLTKDQIRYAAYQLMLKPNGESLMKENAKYDYNLIKQKRNSIGRLLRKEIYKQFAIQVYETDSPNRYWYTVAPKERPSDDFADGTASTVLDAIEAGKRATSRFNNSKENSLNYYEKIIQEKRNDLQVIERGTIRGVKYFIEKITGYSRSVYRGNLEKDGRVVTSTWTCDTIDECKREINKLRDTDALLNNSKEEKGYYQSIIEQKNANTWFKGHTPEDDAKRLIALEPIVKSLKRKGMSPKDIAIELEKKTRPELARQAVQAFYD